MRNKIDLLVNVGTSNNNTESRNQNIRFTNIIALIHASFIVVLVTTLLLQYGFKLGAKLVISSALIPLITMLLNKWDKVWMSRFWLSYIVPIGIILISIGLKLNAPDGYTGNYEFFDFRLLLLASSIIPLLVFPRTPLAPIAFGLLPSAFFLLFFEYIHQLFGIGYNDLFSDPKGGYYISGLIFDAGYLFMVLGLLSLKKSNESLVKSNRDLIDDLHNKNKIQEKILLRKQELLSQNREVSENLLKKQEEILMSKKELEEASNLIKKQKDELEFINIELNSKVEDRTRELKKANNELVLQNNGLLQFSNTVSHNLRAPVASLLGLIHLFEIENGEAEKKEILSHIKESSIALDTIISDLNKVVDIKNRLFHLKENISLADEVANIKSLLQGALNETGALIETDFKIKTIYFIRSYIHSILFNLINNAIKYSNPEIKNKITIRSWQCDENICIEIKDCGLGIDLLKFGNSLFKMHKRFHTHVDGKGMGLYLAKQQIEAMSGKISVKSKLNEGASFLMEFPIPQKVHFQEYYKSPYATIAYDAHRFAALLIWHKTPSTQDYKDALNAVKEMFINYNVVSWLIDIRNLGQMPSEDRAWFTTSILPHVIEKGCKTVVLVKYESDGKDFAYWQNMLEVMNKMGVGFNMFFDYDEAIAFLRNKTLIQVNT